MSKTISLLMSKCLQLKLITTFINTIFLTYKIKNKHLWLYTKYNNIYLNYKQHGRPRLSSPMYVLALSSMEESFPGAKYLP